MVSQMAVQDSLSEKPQSHDRTKLKTNMNRMHMQSTTMSREREREQDITYLSDRQTHAHRFLVDPALPKHRIALQR